MTSPDDERSAKLKVHLEDPLLEATVIDDQLRAVDMGEPEKGVYDIAVRPGVYDVSFRAGDTTATRTVDLRSVNVATVSSGSVQLPFSSAAPLAGTATTHEFQRDPAASLSRGAPANIGAGVSKALEFGVSRGPGAAADGSVLLFVRGADGDAVRPFSLGSGIQILDHNRHVLVDLAQSPASGHGRQWSGQHAALAPGVYFLRTQVTSRNAFDQAFVVARGFQTQLFMIARPDREQVLRPQPATLSILMVEYSTGFDPYSPDLRRTELALQALASGRALEHIEPSELLRSKFANPMLGLCGAHMILRRAAPNATLAKEVIGNLHVLLGPIPDVAALRLAYIDKTGEDLSIAGWSAIGALTAPPMLHQSWKRWVQASHRKPDLITEESPGDRIAASAASAGAWLLWRAGALYEPAGELHLKELEMTLREEGVSLSMDTVVRALRVPHVTAARAAAALLGRLGKGQNPEENRFEALRRPGQALLDAGDVDGAINPLPQASRLKPDDISTVLFIADAHIGAKRFQQAQDLLEQAMNARKRRRSPELASLRHRMAQLSQAAGDATARLEWLNSAIEADMNNGEVASELAMVAQSMGQLEIALKALRAITMLKGDSPMSRAEAFYRQAVIVAQKGEPRRAVLWAKKAKQEDAAFPGVDKLLAELDEA